jgi:hypothetical protein
MLKEIKDELIELGEKTAKRISDLVYFAEDFDWERYKELRQIEDLEKWEFEELEKLENELGGISSKDEALSLIYSSVVCKEYRSGWGKNPDDLETTECKLTLVKGVPEVVIFAEYVGGFIQYPVVRCRDGSSDWISIYSHSSYLEKFVSYFNKW